MDKGLKYVGTNPIKGMALGSQEGHKLYLGGTLIWEDPIIEFEDPAVEAICVANWGDHKVQGKITESEAAAVTTLNNAFYGNNTITKFNELRYFTKVTSLYSRVTGSYAAGQFYNCTKLKSVMIPENVSVFSGAFRNCSSLEEIDLTTTKRESITIVTAFYDSSIKKVVLPGVKYTGIGYHTFRDSRLVTIEIQGTADWSNFDLNNTSNFSQASNLTNITGTIIGIKTNISLSSCSKLTRDSLLVIINGLADLTGTTGKTLTLHATAKARLTADDMAIAQNKNWQIA